MDSKEYFERMEQRGQSGTGGGWHISWWIAFLVIAKILHALYEAAPK